MNRGTWNGSAAKWSLLLSVLIQQPMLFVFIAQTQVLLSNLKHETFQRRAFAREDVSLCLLWQAVAQQVCLPASVSLLR